MNVSDITPDLMRLARWWAGHVLDCEHAIDDAIQNALIQLWRKGHPVNFLPRGAYWAALKIIRKRHHHQMPVSEDGDEIEVAVDHSPPDSAILERERRHEIRGQVTRAVSTMTERQRQVLSMRLELGSYTGTGQQLGISFQAASDHGRRAIQKLRAAS